MLDVFLNLSQFLSKSIFLSLSLLAFGQKILMIFGLFEYLLPFGLDAFLELFDLMLKGFVLLRKLSDFLFYVEKTFGVNVSIISYC
jgi:hypothetical protein